MTFKKKVDEYSTVKRGRHNTVFFADNYWPNPNISHYPSRVN